MNYQKTKQRVLEGPVDWLAAVILSWLIPLGLIPGVPVTYLTSLVLWVLPIALLLPRFFQKSDPGGRRRRAMRWTVVYIAVAGAVLDLVFGALILEFGPRTDFERKYTFMIPAIGGAIPIEELLFYLTGGIAIVLVYFWADEHWLYAYNVRQRRAIIPERGRLLFFSGRAAAIGIALFALGVVAKSLRDGSLRIPYYFTFLVAVAFIPAMALFRNVKSVVNWRAFSFTALYVLLTSCLWEATLGLKREWWGYKDRGMIGVNIADWGAPFSKYPIEALLVWIVVTFSCVLMYEAVKAYQYDPRRGAAKKLFGREPSSGRTPASEGNGIGGGLPVGIRDGERG